MIKILVPYQDEPIVYDTNACAVEQGSLIVFSDEQGMRALAGFAPGAWVSFDIQGG